DGHVTGVQTCALPISPEPPAGGTPPTPPGGSPPSAPPPSPAYPPPPPTGYPPPPPGAYGGYGMPGYGPPPGYGAPRRGNGLAVRSEERRVGKEWRRGR